MLVTITIDLNVMNEKVNLRHIALRVGNKTVASAFMATHEATRVC